jgi:peptide/nickel transport system permease protein
VFGILKYRFWNTIFLMGAAMSFTLVFGAGLGMLMAWKRGSALDDRHPVFDHLKLSA